MNKKGNRGILVIIVLLLVGYMSRGGVGMQAVSGDYQLGEWCYQETANKINANDGTCSLDYTGEYGCEGAWNVGNCDVLYDGRWDTGLFTNPEGTFYINYTKPVNANILSLWQVSYLGWYNNLTIPSSCWSQTPLQFKVFSNLASYTSSYYCKDGKDWYLLDVMETGLVFEEAMLWNIEQEGNWKANIKITGPNKFRQSIQLTATTPSELLNNIISWFIGLF